MALPAAVDKIVFIGDSITQNGFGRDLTTPNAEANLFLQLNGITGFDVYGYGFTGYTVDGIRPEAQTAYNTFGNTALYIIQIGTNNTRGVYESFDQTLSDQYQALCDIFVNGGAEFILGTIPFRGDGVNPITSAATRAIYDNDTVGAKPWNDNIVLPIIQANVPSQYVMPNGNPVTDFYANTRKHYYQSIGDDGIHFPAADVRFYLLSRLLHLFNGDPQPAPVSGEVPLNTFIVDFTNIATDNTADPRQNIVPLNDVISSATIPLTLSDRQGATINLSIDMSGAPIVGQTGNPAELFQPTASYFHESLAVEDLLFRGFRPDNNNRAVPAVMNLSGLAPNSNYSIKITGYNKYSEFNNYSMTVNNGIQDYVLNIEYTDPPTVLSDLEFPLQSDANGNASFSVGLTSGAFMYNVTALEIIPPSLPTVSAGPDITPTEGDTVTLLGATASNFDSLQWACTTGQTPTFSDATVLNPTVTFNEAGLHTLQLMATNSEGSANDTLNADVQAIPNVGPTANAGPDQSDIAAGATVTLDGSGSTDLDGTITAYAWSQIAGDTVTLSDTTAVSPTFTAPTASTAQTLTFQLVVTDSNGNNSQPATVNVQIAAQVIESTLNATLTGIPDGTYKTRVIDIDSEAVLFLGDKAWANESATFALANVAVGTNVEYYAFETGTRGAGLEVVGVTE